VRYNTIRFYHITNSLLIERKHIQWDFSVVLQKSVQAWRIKHDDLPWSSQIKSLSGKALQMKCEIQYRSLLSHYEFTSHRMKAHPVGHSENPSSVVLQKSVRAWRIKHADLPWSSQIKSLVRQSSAPSSSLCSHVSLM